MTRVMIEVRSEEGMKLLENLQNLQIIRVLSLPKEPIRVDESWVGSISKETADKWLAHVEESKNEWDRGF